MPVYSKRDKEGYTRVQQNYSGFWQRAHWLIARSGLLGDIPKFEGQKTVIHHRNFDESDNRPENLQFQGDGDHARLHRELVERNTHWQSEEFEVARVAALGLKVGLGSRLRARQSQLRRKRTARTRVLDRQKSKRSRSRALQGNLEPDVYVPNVR